MTGSARSLALAAGLSVALGAAGGQAAAKAAPPLPGKTVDYPYDGKDVGHVELGWTGRAYVPPEIGDPTRPVPLLVFLHGLNAARIPHRWMGGGNEGDVRRIVGELVTRGALAPVVIAGPSSIVASEVTVGASWRRFDLDNFIARTLAATQATVTIDPTRIVVAGHSGAGCSSQGGLETLGKSRRKLLAILSIDTCMPASLATALAASPADTHVVVSYQSATWASRPFDPFRQAFAQGVAAHPPAPGVLREIDWQRPKLAPHDATVALTFERWLPRILPP